MSTRFLATLEPVSVCYLGAIRLINDLTGCGLPMCRAEVSSCYEGRSDEIGCRNPEFFEMPVAQPSFRVFAQLRD